MRIGRLQTGLDVVADETEFLDVVPRVQPLAARAADRDDQRVAVLPGAQGLSRDVHHLRDSADAVDAGAILVSLHTDDRDLVGGHCLALSHRILQQLLCNSCQLS